jgi:hypothetical protein
MWDLVADGDRLGEVHGRAAADADDTVTAGYAVESIVHYTLGHVDEGRV